MATTTPPRAPPPSSSAAAADGTQRSDEPLVRRNRGGSDGSDGSDGSSGSGIRRSRSLCKLNLTPAQVARRKALMTLAAASNLPLFHSTGDDDGGEFEGGDLSMRVSVRGVAIFSGASAVGYYLLRLVSRDLLGGFAWYRALAKKDSGVRMFELYMLSIVNAGLLTGYSIFKVSTDWRNTTGCKRLLASVLGYFIHDFIAVRSTWRQDIPTVIHHIFGIALVAGAFRVERAHKLVPRFAIIELSTVFLSAMWLLKGLGLAGTREYVLLSRMSCTGHGITTYKLTLFAFAASFFATRVVAMPASIYQLWDHPDFKAIGKARGFLVALSALNMFWFYKIVLMAKRAASAS